MKFCSSWMEMISYPLNMSLSYPVPARKTYYRSSDSTINSVFASAQRPHSDCFYAFQKHSDHMDGVDSTFGDMTHRFVEKS